MIGRGRGEVVGEDAGTWAAKEGRSVFEAMTASSGVRHVAAISRARFEESESLMAVGHNWDHQNEQNRPWETLASHPE